MTAIIYTLPVGYDRDDYEFERKGTSSYTRACDEGAALHYLLTVTADRSLLLPRVYAFGMAVAYLATYRDDAHAEILLSDGQWRALIDVPGVLLMMVGSELLRHCPAPEEGEVVQLSPTGGHCRHDHPERRRAAAR